MNLRDFPDHIMSLIVARGMDYFSEGNVKSIQRIAPQRFRAVVAGTRKYTVDVTLGPQEEILASSCSCPYDQGRFCKHEVAVFYALAELPEVLTEEELRTSQQDFPRQLGERLRRLNSEELIAIILEIAEKNPEWGRSLSYNCALPEEEIAASKQLIWSTLRKGTRIATGQQAREALRGAREVLDKAAAHTTAGNVERSLLLCLEVLSAAFEMLTHDLDCDGEDYYDDGDHYEEDDCDYESYGVNFVQDVLAQIDEAMAAVPVGASEELRVSLMNTILCFYDTVRNGNWGDEAVSLIDTCVYLAATPKLHAKLTKVVNEYLADVSLNPTDNEYVIYSIKATQLKLIKASGNDVNVDLFLEGNREHANFRREAIERAITRTDFRQAMQWVEEGEEINGDALWHMHRYKIYEMSGDTHSLRAMTLELFLNRQYEYYSKLKELYTQEEWPDVQRRILEHFGQQPYLSDAHRQFLVAEGLTDHLMGWCRRNPKLLESCHGYLSDKYQEEIKQMFLAYITDLAQRASSRSRYREVCAVLAKYKEACGATAARELVESFRRTYYRRPAFVEELSELRL